jgi:glycosyltransferase involved in cell wall biosynthesis
VNIAGWHHAPVKHSFPFFIYPLDKNSGEGTFAMILQDLQPDIILLIGDVWDFYPLRRVISEYKDRKLNALLIGWITVDGECLHSSWAELFQSMDGVATFSYFGQKEIELNSKVYAEVIYPGVDHEVFFPREIQLASKAGLAFDPKKNFVILSIAQNTDRKNIPLLLETFSEFCRERKDAFLFLGTDPHDSQGFDLWDMLKYLNLGKQIAVAKDIHPIDGVTDKKLAFIYNLATILTSSSIGEGFCLPIIEAMACGVPVVATDYTTPTELLAQDRGRLIKVGAFLRGAFGIRRAIASKEDFLKHLDSLYKDWQGTKTLLKGYKDRGIDFAKGLTWDKTAEQLNLLFDKTEEKAGKSRVWVKKNVLVKDVKLLMVIPSWGKNCGIAEYTKTLVENLRKKDIAITIYPSADLKGAINFAVQNKINCFHLQHEFSFWPDRIKLAEALQELNSKNIKTILTLHSFCRGLISYNVMLVNKLDKLIVHAQSFKDELCSMNFLEQETKNDIDNVEFIPMGCDAARSYTDEEIKETRKMLGIEGRSPIIGSFGFLREQKGYNDLILAVKELKDKFPNILCLVYAPLHEFGSRSYDEQFFKFIEREKLVDVTLVLRDYSEKEKMLKILQAADLFVLNYKDSPAGGGISSAIKTLMVVQRPIIASNSIAFKDLKDEIAKLTKNGVSDIAKAIDQVWSNQVLKDVLVGKTNNFLAANSWSIVAERHVKVYGE